MAALAMVPILATEGLEGQNILGHASMATTADVYSHIVPAYRREAVSALAAHLDRWAAAQVSPSPSIKRSAD